MNESINTRKYTQKLWNKVKDTFLTKEYVIKGALVGQEWTLFESTVGNSPIVLPPSDSFIELYIEMYSSNNGTITHQKTMRMDSILFESDNMEYREIVLDSMYDAQTYVRYDFATNSIIPTVYEGDEITDSSSDIITTIYTKTNKIEAGSIEAEKIVIDNTTNNLNAKNMQGALDEVVDKLNNLSDGNPQDITKEDIGLGNVDNTSDLDKPVSTATQTAIDNSLSESKGYTDTKVADLVGTAPETLNTLEEVAQAINDNEDVVEALNSAIGNKANQSDLDELSNIVDTKASQDDLTELQNTVNKNIGIQLSEHTSNTSNPHGVTASQVGLDNVDNTSDMDKPVSTVQQAAINNAVTESKGYTDTKVAELVGTVPETLNTLEKVAQAIEDNGDAIETLNGNIETKANQSDLEALSNTVDTKASQDDLVELQSTVNENIGVQLSTHTSNTSNPHGVTASQLGLDNVDNTSDLDKPVSTATQTAIDNVLSESKGYTDTKVADLVGSAPETLDTLEEVAQAIKDNEDVVTALNSAIGNKANQSDLEALQCTVTTNETNLNTHVSNNNNPHNVTKEQLGLGEVDNTSDINKPVSTPQQEAINNAVTESKGYTDTKVAELVEDVIGDDGTELTGTLLSGQTTITFTSEEITNDSKLNAVYTSIFDVQLQSATFGDGTLTLVFPAQEEDMEVVALINATSSGDDIVAREVMDDLNTHVKDTDNPHGVIAEQVSIDNSTSGVNANNVQGAIDEVVRTLGYTVTSKNLLPNITKSVVKLGLTFTYNSDRTVTVNGTATEDCWYDLCHRITSPITLKKNSYVLSGCANGGSDSGYYMAVIKTVNGSGEEIAKDYGNGVSFTLNEDTNVGAFIYIKEGTTVNNLTFYPMISEEGGEYEPYVEDVQAQINTLTNVERFLQVETKTANSDGIIEVFNFTPTRRCIVNITVFSMDEAVRIIQFVK